MALEAGIVGLQGSGKTTLFNALTGAAVAPGSYEQHVGVAAIADDRLEQVAPVVGSAKVTPASLRVVDVPGTGAAMLGHLRRADALLAVLDGFSPGAAPDRDLETLRLELLVADRDHVEKRLEAVRPKARAGEPDARLEADTLERALALLESERPLSEYEGELPAALEPLTTKPLLAIENGPGGIDCKLEVELADLADDEAAAFREGPSALVEVVRRLRDALGLVTFFTANENEARAWTLPGGRTALEAAESIHTDMARGFVRCEVIRWNDLVASGSRAEAARRGLQRLEGKTYVVEDGDVLQIRFTPPRGH
jgi:ribosome-binding ATPase YchF (GTP1/OBG family)